MNALYDTIGKGYAKHRRPDPRIARMIENTLGDARTVINIGAGTGSYESPRTVAAIEPSATMIAQRSPDAVAATQGSAEQLPFPDKSFDAATAFMTTHHWADLDKGLREMQRVARGACVFFDQEMTKLRFWLLNDYFPEMMPRMTALLPLEQARAVFGQVRVIPVPVPHDCVDGFFCAFWRRPEAYLDKSVRDGISFFAKASDVEERVARLKRDIADGTWARKNAALLDKREMDYGYRIIVANESGTGRAA